MTPYYDDGQITIYHGDCREILPQIAPESVDLVLTDPPYGTTACAWDSVIPLDDMWSGIDRVSKTAAAVVLFASQPFTSALIMSNPHQFRYTWVWEKSVGTGFLDAQRKPLRCHEDIAVFYRKTPTYNPQKWVGEKTHSRGRGISRKSEIYQGGYQIFDSDQSGMKYPRSVVYFEKHTSTENLHPTQKPLDLCSYLIQTYSNPGDMVLDFACGSGTALRAARDLGRRAIGIDLEECYCEIAVRRLQQAVLPLAMG